MAPSPADVVSKALPSSSAKKVQEEKTSARILGSGCAGLAELMVFHPVWS